MTEPTPPDGALVARRLAVLRGRIRDVGGDAEAVEVVGVTKGLPPPVVAAARSAGLESLGENYAQELLAKVAWLASSPAGEPDDGQPPATVRWQFIGALQRNKVRLLAAHVDRWQSIDRSSLIDELARRAPGARLLLQVNTTGEGQKSGCRPDEVGPLVDQACAAGLAVEGLMTVGPTDATLSPARSFALLRTLVDRHGLRWCSMGMSDDLEVAVREGTNMIRIGRALFGPRHRRAIVGN